MPEYSSTTITPADSVKVPAMNGSTSGNFQLDALRNFILASKGQANGLASLGSDGKLPAAQLPDLADDVLVYANYATFPASGTAGKLYIAADTNKIYRWDDSLGTPAYVYLKVDWSDLTDGTVTVQKAECDASGNTITSTYETKADANDLKNALDATNKRVENLEEKAGDYTEASVKSVWSVPSGKGKNILLAELEGKQRVNNNLFDVTINPQTTRKGVAINYDSDGYLTLNGTANDSETVSGWFGLFDGANLAGREGHKAICNIVIVSGTVTGTFSFSLNGVYAFPNAPAIFTVPSSASVGMNYSNGTVFTNVKCKVVFTDETLYFNGTIPSDADTIAKIQTNYPWLLTPSSYGTSMVKTRYEGFTSVGVNIWDEDWDNGYLWAGSPASGTNVRSKNYIEVKPNTTYYLCTTAIINISFYDASKNSLSSGTGTQLGAGQTFTTDADTHYIKFFMDSTYGSSYGNNIQIALDSSSAKTTYHPYSKHTLSLPTPIELGSAGAVAEKAYLNEDGEAWKTNPIGHVANMGIDLAWTAGDNVNEGYYATLSNPLRSETINAIISNGFEQKTTYNAYSSLSSDKCFWKTESDDKIYIKDKNNGLPSSFLAGVSFDYEYATPLADTPLTPLLDNLIATEGGGTLEATKTYPIDDSFTVGYLTL